MSKLTIRRYLDRKISLDNIVQYYNVEPTIKDNILAITVLIDFLKVHMYLGYEKSIYTPPIYRSLFDKVEFDDAVYLSGCVAKLIIAIKIDNISVDAVIRVVNSAERLIQNG